MPNPLHQNYRHVKAIAEFLDLDEDRLHSVVMFLGECEFKTEMPPNVMLKGVHTTYAKWIRQADDGGAKAKLANALRGAKPVSPYSPEVPQQGLPTADSEEKSGRRDWTRTNDPHHVKVVL
jgi:hypothetical protein